VSIHSHLYTYLAGNADLTDVVGADIYPAGQVSDTAGDKRATYYVLTRQPDRHQTDASDMNNVRLQMDCYGVTLADAREVAEAVEKALDEYVGYMGSMDVRHIVLTDERDMTEPPTGARQVGMHRVVQDYTVWYIEG